MDSDKRDFRIMISGDSISRGVIYNEAKSKYVILENNYVALVQRKLKGIVNNTAKFGNTIIKGIAKLKKDISTANPDVVFIEYGGNDCDFNWTEIANNPESVHLPKTEFNVFEKKLGEIITFLKNCGITPVLMSLPPLNADKYFLWISRNNPLAEVNILKWLGSVTKIYWWQERYNSIIIKVAEETKTKWIDIRGAFLQYPDFTEFLCSDGIHPNEQGHRIIANKILDFIKTGYGYLLKDKVDLAMESNPPIPSLHP